MDATLCRLPEIEIRRKLSDVTAPRRRVNSPMMAVRTLHEILADREAESLIAIFLDSRHKMIGWHEAARGGLNVVHIVPRDVFRPALLAGAAAVIIAHNHPAGDPSPSAEDDDLTRRLKAAADVIGVPLLDHVVVAAEGFYSYQEKGRL